MVLAVAFETTELVAVTVVFVGEATVNVTTPLTGVVWCDLLDSDALFAPLESGYYEQPRKTSLRDLAEQTAVARSTYEEHLRKAENKLLTNAGQFLRLVTATSTTDPLGVESGREAEQAAD